jgi:hypothetical protein
MNVNMGDWPCWIVSNVDGLHIRRSGSQHSHSDGYLNAGQSLPASCEAVDGDYYDDCGGSEYWIPVPYKDRTDYVAAACVDWYTSDTDDDPDSP